MRSVVYSLLQQCSRGVILRGRPMACPGGARGRSRRDRHMRGSAACGHMSHPASHHMSLHITCHIARHITCRITSHVTSHATPHVTCHVTLHVASHRRAALAFADSAEMTVDWNGRMKLEGARCRSRRELSIPARRASQNVLKGRAALRDGKGSGKTRFWPTGPTLPLY